MGFFILDNLFPIGTGQEHKVELVLVLATVLRLFVRKTGLAVIHGAPGRLDIRALTAHGIGEVRLEGVFFIRVKDFWQLLSLQATLEEVLLSEKIATLTVDRIIEVLVFAIEAGVSQVLGLLALLEVFGRPHELVGAVGGLDRGDLDHLKVMLGNLSGLSDETLEPRGNHRFTGVICHVRLIVAFDDLVIIVIGAHEGSEIDFGVEFLYLTRLEAGYDRG